MSVDTLSKFGVPELTKDQENRGGIIMPIYSYRFRVTFAFPDVDGYLLTQNLVDVTTDLKNKCISLNIRQGIVGEQWQVIDSVARMNGGWQPWESLQLDFMDGGNDNTYHSLLFNGVKCEEHTFRMDYALSDVATHKFKLSYKTMKVLPPIRALPASGLSNFSTEEKLGEVKFATPQEIVEKMMAEKESVHPKKPLKKPRKKKEVQSEVTPMSELLEKFIEENEAEQPTKKSRKKKV
jgi:hypothetical protein